MFKVVKYEENHLYSLDFSTIDHRQATTTMVGELIKENLVNPKVKYKLAQVMQ